MADQHHSGHTAEHGHGGIAHPVSVKLLLGVFFSLVALTIITVKVNDLPLGKLDIWAALVIAFIKASLVCLFFMHMYWEKGMNLVAFMCSFLFVTLFIGFTLMDTGEYRDNIDAYQKKLAPPVPVVSPPSQEIP